MPSACTKPEKKASPEADSPAKQCLLVVDKKVRNLEKKKQKLDSIREKAAGGTQLNEDQKEAVGRYDAVVQNLEFARELKKQFASLMNDMEKQSKKQMKRESHERQQTEIRRIKELLSLQNLLDSLGAEDVRADFVAGSKGAVQLTEDELNKLDELYKLISPTRDEENVYTEQLSAASEHIVNFLDAREKEVVGTTYKDLKAIVEKINGCGYFEAKADSSEEAAEESTETPEVEEEAESTESPVAEEPAAPVEVEATQEAEDFSQQQAAGLDFGGDAAAAIMLGQSQPSASQQMMEEPTSDNPAPDADTFFSTVPFPEPRPFNEIVDSVQTNFTFLQDSEIDPNKASAQQQQQQAMDPAVMAAAAQIQPPVTQPSSGLSFLGDPVGAAAAAASQYQTQELTESQSAAASLQYNNSELQQPAASQTTATSQAAASAFESDPTSMYSGISQAIPPQNSAGQPAAAAGFGGADNGTDAGPPQPIPMPGQYSGEPDQSQNAAAAAPHDRNGRQQFSMNPNANIFQSMYSSGEQPAAQQEGNNYPNQQATGAAAGGADNRQQAWAGSADFQSQGYGGGQYGGRRGNQQGAPNSAAGGYRGNQQGRNGAAGGPNNMNGYRGGNPRSAPGNQRGGNSRGGYNGGPNRGMQQGGGMRGPAGGNSGGAYKGYPARNDYQPEGGYQGYNTPNAAFMQPSQGGPRGGPRSSAPRSGRGGGSYGNRMPPQ